MKICFLLIIFVFISCNNPFQNPVQSGDITTSAPESFVCNYEKQKEKAKQARNLMHPSDQKESLTSIIIDSLIPCWYGTEWDFNGTTETPGEGKIACGYFVTTIVRDAGLPVERTKMAQCASEEMIQNLCLQGSIKRFSNQSIDIFENSIKKSGKGIYIVGLDNHTGFIYNDGNQVFFIHASYIQPKCVLKEPAITSSILVNSKYKVVGKLRI